MKGFRALFVPLLLAPVLATGCGPKAEKSASASTEAKPVPVTLAEAESRPIERTVDAVGTLKGWDG